MALDTDSTKQTLENRPPDQDDPLLACIALMTQLQDQPVSMAALKSGFPLGESGLISEAVVPEIAERFGFQAKWVKGRATSLPNYALPVIARLHDGRVVIVQSLADSQATVLFAESGMRECSMGREELEELIEDRTLIFRLKPKTSKQALLPLKNEAFGWFWGTMWRFRRFYYESMVATVVANVLTLATVFFAMTVYDRVIPTQAVVSLWTLTIGVIIALLIEFGMRWLKARLVDEGGKRADLAVNATLLREIMSIRLEYRPQSIGIFSSSMRDFDALRDFMSSSLFVTIADLPFVILFLVVIWVIAGPLVLIPLTVLLILLITAFLVQPALVRAMRDSMRQAGEKQSVLVESVLNLEVLKAHNAESYLQRRWEKSNHAAVQSFMTIRKVNALVTGLTTTLAQGTTVAVIVFGVFMVFENTLTIGAMIATKILVGRVLVPANQFVQLATRYQQAKSALQVLDGLMQRPRDRDHDQRYLQPEAFTGSISASNIEFAYPDSQNIPVLKDVSLRLQAHDRVALLGQIGSGKSTLLRIMAGMYKPLRGSVRVDDIDVLQIDPAEFRSRVGYVGQDSQLFMGTLRENLVLSNTWISDKRILEVLEDLNLHQMVMSHPLGLDMPLTEAGGGLSGGQRQLLSVARMMLREPVYVFMDEPTANMDQDTEARVIRVVGDWLKGRTLILSTHRSQLLAWVDRIAVLHAGQIVREGPRDEILRILTRPPAVSNRTTDPTPDKPTLKRDQL